MAQKKYRNPVAWIIGIILVLIVLAEGALLVGFVRTRILTEPASSPDASDTGEADSADTPKDPSAPSELVEPTEPAETEPDTGGTDSGPDSAGTQTESEPPEQTGESDVETDPVTARAQEILAGMTTWEKVCQMFVVTPESLTGVATATQAGEQTRLALAEYPVGGLVYFAQNLLSSDQVLTMIANTQSYSELGLLIAVDEEGGTVNRLMRTLGTTYIDSMYTYKDDGVQTARENAQTIAADLAAYGFNVDFAPVADVWSNPDNTVIGVRAYSDDFAQAADLVAAAVAGFHDEGIICTLKHFPGHGDTAEDSHNGAAYVNKTKAELEAGEFLPFQAGIEAGADMVMVGHLTVPAIDDEPAVVSYTLVTEILRGELGFDGVVITDSLEMGAVNGTYTAGELAVRCIEAGVDILLEPASLREAVDSVMDAIDSGRLTESRIDESVLRILSMKLNYGIIS